MRYLLRDEDVWPLAKMGCKLFFLTRDCGSHQYDEAQVFPYCRTLSNRFINQHLFFIEEKDLSIWWSLEALE